MKIRNHHGITCSSNVRSPLKRRSREVLTEKEQLESCHVGSTPTCQATTPHHVPLLCRRCRSVHTKQPWPESNPVQTPRLPDPKRPNPGFARTYPSWSQTLNILVLSTLFQAACQGGNNNLDLRQTRNFFVGGV